MKRKGDAHEDLEGWFADFGLFQGAAGGPTEIVKIRNPLFFQMKGILVNKYSSFSSL